jgi:hypothetical protein
MKNSKMSLAAISSLVGAGFALSSLYGQVGGVPICSSASPAGQCVVRGDTVMSGKLTARTTISASVNGYTYATGYATGGSGTPASPYTSASGTGGIQEAIDAVPVTVGNAAASTVYIPSGYYLISAPIVIKFPVNLIGAGWNTVLDISPRMSAASDVIVVSPTSSSEIKGFTFSDFTIAPQSGTPARNGINLDGVNNVILWGLIRHLSIHQLGGSAIFASGSGSRQGTPVLTTIEDSSLAGGITCLACGDSITITHNQLTGSGTNEFSFQPGATGFVFQENNVTIKGGTHFGSYVVSPKIVNNEFETPVGFIGSNGAVLDIDGPEPYTASGGIITGNTFAVVNSIKASGLRLNNVVGMTVRGNTFERGSSGSTDIVETDKSARNNILDNYWAGGGAFNSMVKDDGKGNIRAFPSPGNGFLLGNNTPLSSLSTAGIAYPMLQMDSMNQVDLNGYLGGHILQSTNGANYFYSGNAPGHIAMALTNQASNIPAADTVTSIGALALSQMLLSKRPPSIAAGFGVSPSIAASNGSAVFFVNVGGGGTAATGTIALPVAKTGWKCSCQDTSTFSTTVFVTRQTSTTTTSCSLRNFTNTAVTAPWAANDLLSCSALAY